MRYLTGTLFSSLKRHGNSVQTPRVRDCLPSLLLLDHNCDELSLSLRRGAAAVLAKFFILREHFLLSQPQAQLLQEWVAVSVKVLVPTGTVYRNVTYGQGPPAIAPVVLSKVQVTPVQLRCDADNR